MDQHVVGIFQMAVLLDGGEKQHVLCVCWVLWQGQSKQVGEQSVASDSDAVGIAPQIVLLSLWKNYISNWTPTKADLGCVGWYPLFVL